MMPAAREQIETLSNSANRIRLLIAISEEPAQITDLADTCNVSRWTVNRAIDEFIEWGWVDTDESLIKITGVGRAVLQKISEISEASELNLEEETWKTFEFFASSEYLLPVFGTILNQSALRPIDIAEQCGVSRDQVGNIISDLEDEGYIENERRPYEPIDDNEVVEDFREFERYLETINDEENNEFLQYFEPPSDFPVARIFGESSVTVRDQDRPHGPTTEFRNTLDTDIEQFYGLTPAASGLFHDVTVPLMEEGISLEAVVAESAVETALSDFTEIMDQGLETASVDAYVYSGDIPFALAVFEETVSIGVFDAEGNHVGDLHGTNEALVNWVMTTYTDYRQEAQPITDYLEVTTG